MAARCVTIDHDTPLLLPPDLRDWVPENHLVHFVMDAVNLLNLGSAQTNHRGTGSVQYPPSMMLGLLIYCYGSGTFSSRKIEGLTYDSVPVRYLCADTHPDHDSICKLRRENKELIESAFHQVLEFTARAKILKVRDITVSVDGTKIFANASKHSAMSHGHACEQMKLLEEEEIAQLLAKAEAADSTPLQDGLSIPEEVRRREDRVAKIKQAVEVIEARAKERLAEDVAAYQSKLEARRAQEQATGKKLKGKDPKPPQEGPGPVLQRGGCHEGGGPMHSSSLCGNRSPKTRTQHPRTGKSSRPATAPTGNLSGGGHGPSLGYTRGKSALRAAKTDRRASLRHH